MVRKGRKRNNIVDNFSKWEEQKQAPDWLWSKYRKSWHYSHGNSIFYKNARSFRYKIINKGYHNYEVYRRKKNFLDSVQKIYFRWQLQILSLLIMLISGLLYQYYKIRILVVDFALIFYLAEIVLVFSLVWAAIKKMGRIRMRSDMSLYLAKILSGVLTVIGIYIFWTFWIIGFSNILAANFSKSFFEFLGLGDLYYIATFGTEFGLPLTGMIIYITIGFGLIFSGGYLFFKFQRSTGLFIWHGEI